MATIALLDALFPYVFGGGITTGLAVLLHLVCRPQTRIRHVDILDMRASEHVTRHYE